MTTYMLIIKIKIKLILTDLNNNLHAKSRDKNAISNIKNK